MTVHNFGPMSRRAALGLGAAATIAAGSSAASANAVDLPSDRTLARSLGFRSDFARVNGVRLHYVIGGTGDPLILLGGWPQTWWQFHKIMPQLARHYRVIAVDLRGMGASGKPESGYDKKTMATDILELVHHLGHETVRLAGHDVGAMVAYSLAANHPHAARQVAMLDVAHADETWYDIKMLPAPGQEPLPSSGYAWWFAFNQIPELPEQLLAGRFRYVIDWLFDHFLLDRNSIGERDRAIYAHAYSEAEAIRASNGWYQTVRKDIEDEKTYGKISTPLLGLGGSHSSGYETLRMVLPEKGTDVRVEMVPNSSHYLSEEQPDAVIRQLRRFFR